MPIINGIGRVGVRPPSGNNGGNTPSYLLDTYGGAAGAYSLRKLSSTYSGNAIRVRRSSDNAEQNIGFDGSGNLDEASLTTFVGSGNGFVTTWYDQSGLGRNMIQTSASNQPKIVSSGILNKLNTKPSLNFNGSQFLAVTDNTILNCSALTSCFYTVKLNSGSLGNNVIASKTYNSDGGYFFGQYGGSDSMQHWIDTSLTGTFFNSILNNQLLFTNINTTGTNGLKRYKNSTTSSLSTAPSDLQGTNNYYFTLGRDVAAGSYCLGEMQEIIIYSTDKSSDRTNIESNINTFYSIY